MSAPSPPRLQLLRAGVLVAACTLAAASTWASETFRANPMRSSDGVYQLEWTREGTTRVEESRHPDFRNPIVVYEGADRATTLTGRVDGRYHYRLIAVEPTGPAIGSGGQIETLEVEVAHHSLARAIAFFGVGLFVFASTVALVVTGDRSAHAERNSHLA